VRVVFVRSMRAVVDCAGVCFGLGGILREVWAAEEPKRARKKRLLEVLEQRELNAATQDLSYVGPVEIFGGVVDC